MTPTTADPTSGHDRRDQAGFTLVELLVATAITLVLAVLLLSTTSGILTAWNNSRGKLTSSNQAKLGLDQIADDLQSLVMRSDGNAWFAVTVTGPQNGQGDAGIATALFSTTTGSRCKPSTNAYDVTPASGNIEDMRFGHVGVWLRFFAGQRSANDATTSVSSVRALAYQISHVPIGNIVGTGRHYFLFRSSVRPAPLDSAGATLDESSFMRSVFTTGYDIVGNNAYNNATGANSGQSEPGSIRRPDNTLVIGNDIIDFGVRIYCRDPSGNLVERFPIDRLGGGTSPVLSFVATSASSVTPYAPGVSPPTGVSAIVRDFPAVIEVMVRVLSDQGALQITALEENRLKPPGGSSGYDAFWWEIATANSTVYTRRIEVPSVPALAR